MKLTPVNSSMISKVGYDAESQTLQIVFLSSGKAVNYLNVPERVYHELKAARSPGTYAANKVITCFDYHYAQENSLGTSKIDE